MLSAILAGLTTKIARNRKCGQTAFPRLMERSTDIVTLQDLGSALSEATGADIAADHIQPVGAVTSEVEVADATRKFRVTLPDFTQGFAILSSPVSPDLIARAARNIAQARADVSTEVAAPILPTLATGHVGDLSFALWPARSSLQDGGRLHRYMRRHSYATPICTWYVDMIAETCAPASPDVSAENLAVITNDPMFSDPMRQIAQEGQDKLLAGDIALQHCLQHGDFWIGNVLQPEAGDAAPFFIIDWAGMNQNGYPFIDLCSMLLSLRCSHRYATRHMARAQARLGCDQMTVLTTLLSGLGHLGRNLEYFPPDRYRRMAEDMFRFAKATTR